MSDQTLIILIASIVAIHFIIGFAWVFKKIYGKNPDNKPVQNRDAKQDTTENE